MSYYNGFFITYSQSIFGALGKLGASYWWVDRAGVASPKTSCIWCTPTVTFWYLKVGTPVYWFIVCFPTVGFNL